MDQRENMSNEDPELLKQQIQETRSALSQKIQNLETGFKGTVQEAKMSVQERVEEVKSVFDLKHHITAHPWESLGGAMLLGLAAGSLSPTMRDSHSSPKSVGTVESTSPGIDLWEEIRDQIEIETRTLRTFALGSIVKAAHEIVRRNVPPPFASSVERIFSNVERKIKERSGS